MDVIAFPMSAEQYAGVAVLVGVLVGCAVPTPPLPPPSGVPGVGVLVGVRVAGVGVLVGVPFTGCVSAHCKAGAAWINPAPVTLSNPVPVCVISRAVLLKQAESCAGVSWEFASSNKRP